MKIKGYFLLVVIAAFLAVFSSPALAQHTPVPGPNFAGCLTLSYPSPTASWRPVWDVTGNPTYEVESGRPILYPPPGGYDFCLLADAIYCSLNISILPSEVFEFADLVQCRFMDINGPLDLEAEIPVGPNGVLDAQYELGILAFVLNTPGHPLHEEVTIAFQENFKVIRDMVLYALSVTTLSGKSDDLGGDKNLRPIINLMAPHLTSALSAVLAGFATMGDETTNLALDELVGLLEDIGLTPPEGGIGSITTGIPALGPFGDIDGDGYSNYAEYQYFVGELQYTAPQYVSAALDSNQRPPRFDPEVTLTSRTGFVKVGDNVKISMKLTNYYEMPEYIRWYKDGQILAGETWYDLDILNAQVEDSGVYRVEVGVLVEVDKELVETELTASLVLTVGDIDLPIGGALGLTVFASACALAGVLGLRRRK